MEGLKLLCKCCKYENCLKEQIIVRQVNNCKSIKCLQFIKDESKIIPPPEFVYIVRSDEQ